jgi:RNA polymerase sigma-70 factor (ECF subfamily)
MDHRIGFGVQMPGFRFTLRTRFQVSTDSARQALRKFAEDVSPQSAFVETIEVGHGAASTRLVSFGDHRYTILNAFAVTAAENGREAMDKPPEEPVLVGGTAGAAPLTPLSLLQRVRANNQQAWQQLVALYRPLVLFWCRRGGLAAADVEDVTLEIFAAAAAGLERFHRDRQGDTFRGWLRVIARNQVLLHFRRNKDRPRAEGGSDAWQHMQEVVDPLAGTEAEESAEISHLYRRALEQVRSEFEEHTWHAFCRTVLDGRSPAALADELGMSAAAIRQAKSRVLRRLKEEVGDLLD